MYFVDGGALPSTLAASPRGRRRHIEIPGFSNGEIRPYRRPAQSDLHKARVAAVRRSNHDASAAKADRAAEPVAPAAEGAPPAAKSTPVAVPSAEPKAPGEAASSPSGSAPEGSEAAGAAGLAPAGDVPPSNRGIDAAAPS